MKRYWVFFVFRFSVDHSFAGQEIQADHETLMKINAAGESEYSVYHKKLKILLQ